MSETAAGTQQNNEEPELFPKPLRHPVWLGMEFVSLFLLSPLCVVYNLLPNKPIPVLMLSATCVVLLLWKDAHFDLNELVNTKGIRDGLFPVVLRFAALMVLLSAAVLLFEPESLFSLIKTNVFVWALVMIGYPVFSVYPQEIIFRAFVFYRYRSLFSRPLYLVLASATAFGWVHIVFGSWVSVALSFLGGVLFSLTYLRYKSLLLVAIEHALYGQFIFTIGLGRYFYHGSVHWQ